MFAETAYLFRHAMLRDAAYQLQLPTTRARLHGMVIEIVECLALGRGEVTALELAEHARAAQVQQDPAQQSLWRARQRHYLQEAVASLKRSHQYPAAAEALRRMAELSTGDDSQRALLLADASRCFELAGDVRRAGPATSEALGLARQVAGMSDLCLELELRMADIDGVTGNNTAAIAMYESIVARAKTVGSLHLAARALMQLASEYHRLGRSEQTHQSLDAAASLVQQLGDERLEGEICSKQGMIQADHGHLALARVQLERAHQIALKGNDKSRLAVTYSHLANIYSWLNLMDDWKASSEAALALNRELGDLRSQMIVVGNRGIIEREEGRHAKALASYLEAEAFAREIGVPHSVGINLVNQCTVLCDLGRVEEAIAKAEEALAIARKLGAKLLLAMGLYANGSALSDFGRKAEAEPLLLESKRTLEELGDEGYLGWVMIELGDLLIETGRLAKARAEFIRALQLAESMGESKLAAMAGARMAVLHLKEGDSLAAETLATKASKYLETNPDSASKTLLICQGVLGIVHARGNDKALARATYDRIKQILLKATLAQATEHAMLRWLADALAAELEFNQSS